MPIGKSFQHKKLVVAMAALAIAGVGCGSGGSANDGAAGGGACTAIGTPGATMSWDDDGVHQCAVTASVTEDSTAMLDLVDVTGATTSLGVGIAVSTQGTPISGSYTCATGTAAQVTFNYQVGSTATFATTCALTIDPTPGDGGTRVTGTFSGLFGTKMITNGLFAATATIVGQ